MERTEHTFPQVGDDEIAKLNAQAKEAKTRPRFMVSCRPSLAVGLKQLHGNSNKKRGIYTNLKSKKENIESYAHLVNLADALSLSLM